MTGLAHIYAKGSGHHPRVPHNFIFKRVDDIPRHPAMLYESAVYFILSAVLFTLWFSKNGKVRWGLPIGILFTFVFGARIVIEFFKENQVDFENGMILNMGQLLSIPFVIDLYMSFFVCLGIVPCMNNFMGRYKYLSPKWFVYIGSLNFFIIRGIFTNIRWKNTFTKDLSQIRINTHESIINRDRPRFVIRVIA